MPVRKKGVQRTINPSSQTALSLPRNIRKIRRILLTWGQKNFKPFPWRDPSESWHALLAEILLQRTRATSAVKVYEEFVSTFPKPSKLAMTPLKRIEKMLYPLGLRWRAPLIKKLAEELVKNHSLPPNSFAELTALPGVGPYAAAAYLSFHGNKRAVIVDANVVRWLCRLVDYECDGETRRKKWLVDLADKLTPKRNWKGYNYAVLDFTMQICTKRPSCEICPIGPTLCEYGQKVLTTRGY